MTRSGSDQYGPYTLAQTGARNIRGAPDPAGRRHLVHGASVRLNVNQLPPFGAVAASARACLVPAPVAPTPASSPVAEARPLRPSACAGRTHQLVRSRPRRPARCARTRTGGSRLCAHARLRGAAAGQGGLHLKRAFTWNLRALPVEPDEEAQLIARGVDEPDARRHCPAAQRPAGGRHPHSRFRAARHAQHIHHGHVLFLRHRRYGRTPAACGAVRAPAHRLARRPRLGSAPAFAHHPAARLAGRLPDAAIPCAHPLSAGASICRARAATRA